MQNFLLKGLFGQQRAGVLAVLYTRPEEWLYQRQIAQLAGLKLQQIQRALAQFVSLGIVQREHRGGRVYYRLNSRFPLAAELRGMVVKTAGVTGIINDALRSVPGVDLAGVFGSIAKGTADAYSDIDLLIIGAVDFAVLTEALQAAHQQLGRDISPIIYTTEEFMSLLRDGNAFLTRILSEPILMVKGERDDFARLGGAPPR